MLLRPSHYVEECFQRAADSADKAALTSNPDMKAFYRRMECRWLHLADSWMFEERAAQFLKTQAWRSIREAPFDRDIQLAVSTYAGMHEVVFPCRRVLHGWIKSDTASPIELRPTHWRDWTK